MKHTLPCFVVALLWIAAPAFAQGPAPVPVPHDQVVSANPFGLIFGWFNAGIAFMSIAMVRTSTPASDPSHGDEAR